MKNKTISLKELSKKLKEYKKQQNFTDKVKVFLKPANYSAILPTIKLALSRKTREEAFNEAEQAIHYMPGDLFGDDPLIKTQDLLSLMEKWMNIAPNSSARDMLEHVVENLEDLSVRPDDSKAPDQRAEHKKNNKKRTTNRRP